MPTMNAISLLKADHKKVKGMLDDLESTTERGPGKRKKLLAKIKTELEAHTTIEEEIFYPAFLKAVKEKEDRAMFFEAVEEHHVVKVVLPELMATDPTSEKFGAKAKVLKELVTHHAKEEEREMFPAAKKVLSDDKLEQLGERMAARKKELLARRR